MSTSRLASRPARRAWTADEIRALGTRTDLVTACQIVYGVGKNTAWSMYHEGRLDFPALRVGRRVVCPMAPILDLMGLADQPPAPAARPALAVVRGPGEVA